MLLALGTLVPLFLGFISHFTRFCIGLRQQGLAYLARGEDYFVLLVASGYVGFIITFTYIYRDFGAMKVIYIFPGMIAFIALFYDGLSLLLNHSKYGERLKCFLVPTYVTLLVCYCVDVALIIRRLL